MGSVIWTARPLWRYGLAVVLVAASLVVRWALHEVVGDVGAYVFIFPAIVLSAVLGGWGPGLLASVLGALGIEILFVQPHWKIFLDLATFLRMLVLLLSGLVLGSIGAGLRALQFEAQAKTAALRESEFFYRQTLESIPGMVFTTRPDGHCDYQSRQWVEFTGIPIGEHIGEIWNTLGHPDDRTRTLAAWRNAVEENASYDLEFRVRRHDGVYRWFRVLGRPIRDAEGRVVRWFAVAFDIEDRKRAQEALTRFSEELEVQVAERTDQLQATVEELRRSNEDLEKFAYISSHDLQEPLRMVSLYVGLLVEEFKDTLDDRALDYIHYAEEGAVRMSQLIKDLLAYSRVNTESRPPAPTDLNALVDQVLADLGLVIAETKARVTHDELPTVAADAGQISQVFQNLVANAIKYRKDTEPPRIHIAAEPRNGQWLIKVRDNGIGIEEQYYDRIFIPFQRLHADRKRYPGSGIGLAIVKRIVERHHGRVCVDSTLGEGTTFYFTLPAT